MPIFLNISGKLVIIFNSSIFYTIFLQYLNNFTANTISPKPPHGTETIAIFKFLNDFFF